MSTRHEGGSIACSLFSSTHTTADKENTLLSKGLAATLEKREREGGRERECVGGRKIHVGKRRMGEKRVRVRREELSYEGREERREERREGKKRSFNW